MPDTPQPGEPKWVPILRSLRRPYASIVTSTALAISVVGGMVTDNWIPAELAWPLSFIIIGDGAYRMWEKTRLAHTRQEEPDHVR
jgi:tryptophan-rich sensory protein